MGRNRKKCSKGRLKQNEACKPESIQAKVLQNSNLPVNRLPPELLVMIIFLARRPSVEMPYPSMPFSWVCHYWRSVLNNPAFWKSYVFSSKTGFIPPPLVNTLLERSKDVPLDVMVENDHSEQVYTILRRLDTSARRVKTLHIKCLQLRPPDSFFSDILSFFPSLENLFCNTYALEPILNASRITPRLKKMQLFIKSIGILVNPGCLLEQVGWLRLRYKSSVPLLPLLQTLQTFSNLQVLILDPPFRNIERLEVTNQITFSQLKVLAWSFCPILHFIDAPKLSYLEVDEHIRPDSVIEEDSGHLFGFDFSKIVHIEFCFMIDEGKVPYIEATDQYNLPYNFSVNKNIRGVDSIFEEFPLFYPNRFFLSFSTYSEDDEEDVINLPPVWLPAATACLQKAINLRRITLNVFELRGSYNVGMNYILNALGKTATACNKLTIRAGNDPFKTVCDILSDGDLYPHLERLTYCHAGCCWRCYGMEKDPSDIPDSLRHLVNGRSATSSKRLKEVELEGFPPLQPQELEQVENLRLHFTQEQRRTRKVCDCDYDDGVNFGFGNALGL